MRNYRDLQVWSKAHNLTLELYRISRQFPREEIYGITSQLRRAAVSIGANMAEGRGRRTSTELARFVKLPWVRPASLIITSCSLAISGLWRPTNSQVLQLS